MDFADMAAEREAIYRAEALARAAGRLRVSGPSAELCRECGAPIPEARRRAVPGVTLCVDCQEEEDNGRS